LFFLFQTQSPIRLHQSVNIAGAFVNDGGFAVSQISLDRVIVDLDKRLIAAKGRKETVGRPMQYGTSKEFLMQFGLKDLSELPSIEDFEDLAGSI
jgi:hypothetical protein